MRYRNRVINFEKCHVFTTLSSKIVFEKHKLHASNNEKYPMHLCHTLFAFYMKTFNLYISMDE